MTVAGSVRLVRFDIDGQAYALHMAAVERVVRAVELTPLPGAPPVIRGVFNLAGTLVPVADPRRLLGLAERELALEDHILVTQTSRRVMGLLAHGDVEVTECPRAEIEAGANLMMHDVPIEGVGKLGDRLVLIQDLARFLSIEEERALDEAMHA